VAISNNGGLDFWGNPVLNGSADLGASDFNSQAVPTGAIVHVGIPFPDASDADLTTAMPSQAATGDAAIASLSQTFQVESPFDLKTIFLGYEYDPAVDPSDVLINIELFEVADVGAAALVQGKSLLTLIGLSLTGLTASDEAAVVLDSAIALEASSGTAGYGLRITGGGNPGFEWRRTGSTSASVYALGQAYEDGLERFGGERDFVLALSSEGINLADNADFDGSGAVDGRDFLAWQMGFGTSSGALPADGDADNDHDVDGDDLAIWLNQHGSLALAASVGVPEPSTLLIIAVALLCESIPPRRRY
ncbi:MAG: hypothetical protein AAGD11_18145, partial [Planctomycetota bacterium]